MAAKAPGLALFTERLVLRDFVPADWQAWHGFAQDPAFWRYLLPMHWNPTADRSRAFVRDMARSAKEEPRREFCLAALHGEDRCLIGGVYLGISRTASWEAELGYWFDPRRHGQGFAAEAARCILAHAFTQLRLHRVWAQADVDNAPSWRVMEKLGMRREGRLRLSERRPAGEAGDSAERWGDAFLYAVLAQDFALDPPDREPAARRAFRGC